MLTTCTVSTSALRHNFKVLQRFATAPARVAPVVKGNAYGHGLVVSAKAFVEAGAQWLCVNSVYEAVALRDAGVSAAIYVLGYVPRDELEQALEAECRMVLYNGETLVEGAKVARRLGTTARFHLKVETGNNRQGLRPDDAHELARAVRDTEGAELEGVASHFANIEDTTDHRFARQQLERFDAFCKRLEVDGFDVPHRHIANSAAAILWPSSSFTLVRAGIAAYGLWPSRETLVAALRAGRHGVELRPALTWTSRIAQLKHVPAGEFIGYGCSYRTTHDTRLAIVPTGYYDGYDRKYSHVGYMLIDGQRAPVRGRVCMNITMLDVTHIPSARLESEVVLLGQSGDETITAEDLAAWSGTINYEVTTRINERIPRVAVP